MNPGAHPDPTGTTFAAWSTAARDVAVRLFDDHGTPTRTEALESLGDGRFAKHLDGVQSGALYAFVLDGEQTPDPYARFLPLGVHGPARVVASTRAEAPLREPPPVAQWVVYELHIGTFSPEGTYRGAEARLDALAELGVTTLEILPVAAFPGARGWGYDGVALYAPHAGYGDPDDLRSLVSAAHERGLAVLLDVVYNHFGPAGNYLSRYAPETSRLPSRRRGDPRPISRTRRCELWSSTMRVTGSRSSASTACGSTPRTSSTIRRSRMSSVSSRTWPMAWTRCVACSSRTSATSRPWCASSGRMACGPLTCTTRSMCPSLASETDTTAYEPTVEALARAINRGWAFTGEPFPPWNGRPRGQAPREHGLAPEHLLYCLQNHDQIGNRARGARLSHHVDADAYCAASVLLLFLPAAPLLFMGQEWAASSPFLFFSDHEGELGETVRLGRRDEFKSFAAFADREVRDLIPDPQAASTFERSKLVWEERTKEPHRRVHALCRELIRLRRSDRVLSAPSGWDDFEATAQGRLEITRRNGEHARRLIVSFANEERRVETSGWRALLASGRFEATALGPQSAAVLAQA